MQSQIIGTTMPVLEFTLEPNDAIISALLIVGRLVRSASSKRSGSIPRSRRA